MALTPTPEYKLLSRVCYIRTLIWFRPKEKNDWRHVYQLPKMASPEEQLQTIIGKCHTLGLGRNSVGRKLKWMMTKLMGTMGYPILVPLVLWYLDTHPKALSFMICLPYSAEWQCGSHTSYSIRKRKGTMSTGDSRLCVSEIMDRI